MLNFLKKSIRNKYFVLLMFLGLVPIIALGLISNYVSSRILETELNKSMYQTLEKASINVDSVIQRISYLSDTLLKNNDIMNSMTEYRPEEVKERKRRINEELKNISALLNFPTHIFIVDRWSNIYSNISITNNEEKKILERIGENSEYSIPSKLESGPFWLALKNNLLSAYDSRMVYYLARNMIVSGENYGVMYIGTGDYILSRMLDNIKLSDESKIFVYDEKEKIMFYIPEKYSQGYEPEKNTVESLLKQEPKPQYLELFGTKNSVTFYKTKFNWSIVMITPVKSISQKLNSIKKVTLTLTVISVVFILVFLLLVNESFVKPIIYLSSLMKIARKGNLEIRSDLRNTDEIGILSEGFNKMLADFKKMIEKIQADELLKKELEFKVLQSQIKPHFLYNTLNSIRWMAEMNNETKVGDSIVSLVRMLEYNTKGNEKLVKVKDEVEYIKEYLNLQMLRYWNKFYVEFEINQEILDFRMLKLSLQPIVENSVLHGLKRNKGKMLLKISGTKQEEMLIFIVADDGAGITEENLNILGKKLQGIEPVSNDSKGIGLVNVSNRIKMEFGESYGISISSEPGKGTEVRMVIPIAGD